MLSALEDVQAFQKMIQLSSFFLLRWKGPKSWQRGIWVCDVRLNPLIKFISVSAQTTFRLNFHSVAFVKSCLNLFTVSFEQNKKHKRKKRRKKSEQWKETARWEAKKKDVGEKGGTYTKILLTTFFKRMNPGVIPFSGMWVDHFIINYSDGYGPRLGKICCKEEEQNFKVVEISTGIWERIQCRKTRLDHIWGSSWKYFLSLLFPNKGWKFVQIRRTYKFWIFPCVLYYSNFIQ